MTKIFIEKTLKRERLDKKGNYDIWLQRENGDRVKLAFNNATEKTFYFFTLLLYKVAGGLYTRHLTDRKSQTVLSEVFHLLYGFSGREWLAKQTADLHHFSVMRTQANYYLKNHDELTPMEYLLCSINNENKLCGSRKERCQIRKVGLNREDIIISDSQLRQVAEQLPQEEDLYKTPRQQASHILGRIYNDAA